MTREEAINKIKKAMPTMWKETKEALSILIPELHESEDEKIRKALIEVAREVAQKQFFINRGTTLENVVAYLEKQKPAEWDEYTKMNLDRALQIIKKAKGNLQGYQSDDGIYECDKAIECLEHFLYRGLEIEKNAEWRDVELTFRGENVKVKRQFFRDDKGHEYSTTEQDEDVAWQAIRAWCEKKGVSLYDLYPREEWSEEDEDFINMLILHFNYLINKGGDSVETYKSYIEKLKSFRPQPHTVSIKNATKFGKLEYERGVKDGIQYSENHRWKPSKEQIEALEDTIFFDKTVFRKKKLVSLLEELKKNDVI